MTTKKQRAAARRNIRSAAGAAKRKKTQLKRLGNHECPKAPPLKRLSALRRERSTLSLQYFPHALSMKSWMGTMHGIDRIMVTERCESGCNRSNLLWLLSGNRTVGSNPTLSANTILVTYAD